MNRQTLIEPFARTQDRLRELGRPLQARVRHTLMRPDGTSLVLGHFAPYKGCALRDAPSDSCALRDAPNKSSAAGPNPGSYNEF